MNIIKNEGVWRLYDRQATLILTDERQLKRLAEAPERPLFADEERGFSGEKRGLYDPDTTLDSFMRDAAERGCVRVEVSYDFFFGGTTRENYPDSELTVRAYKAIHDCALKYGMAFGASLISPLDLGGGYARRRRDTGFSWQFREGEIADGAYRVPMRQQRQWYNNKGPIQLTLNRVMAVAFDEERLGDSSLFFVDERAIEDISSTARVESDEESYRVTGAGYGYNDMVVLGRTDSGAKRVLIVAEYRTPEIDYFASGAQDYINGVIDLHAANGIRYHGYYSDEMHIQFDWDLSAHFGPTEITARYVTGSLIAEYAARYGEKYRDFLKYMVYFAYCQHGFLGSDEPAQHVFGRDMAGAYDTFLFRKRYFEMLSEKVVHLSLEAKAYSERLFGGPIMTRAHATWQESPTCDHFAEGVGFQAPPGRSVTRYDYDKPYVWSSTIRENMSACGDYFRWNEFLTGSGTDHPEGGNADRNYYAQAFACSLGALNRFRRAYCACWGSPAEVVRRFSDVGAAYGTGSNEHGLVQNMEHRLSDVLMLYPTELNYVEERFGSWMVQYGYCDYITEEKLLAYGRATDDGHLAVNGRNYRALVALYEIFVDRRTEDMLRRFVERGGRVLWTGAPGLRCEDGSDTARNFLDAFGLRSVASPFNPVSLEDRLVRFEGMLQGITPMKVLTGYLPDLGYPVVPNGAQVIARCGEHALGVARRHGAGLAVYLGFRPRDDQSRSLGEDVDTLFRILLAIGAYSPDSLEAKSRPTDARYLMNRFSNGAVSVANHYRTLNEKWYGSFFRDEEEDRRLLEGVALPPVDIELDGDELAGHSIGYRGEGALTYNYRAQEKRLSGFAGKNTTGIEIDGKWFELFDRPAELIFSLVDRAHLPDDIEALALIQCDREGVFTVELPAEFDGARLEACERDLYQTSFAVDAAVAGGRLSLPITEKTQGKWIAAYKTRKFG